MACVSPPNSGNLIILDWDDTVIPTTFLANNHVAPEVLSAFAKEAELFLRECRKYGQVVLCTNAELWWPQSSAWTYFPELGDILAEIPVLSAQTTFAPLGYTDPFDWKRLAFEQILTSYQCTNVLSIGDAWYERSAVILACRALATSSCKTVCCKSLKFLDGPDVDALRNQQATATQLLRRVMAHEGCLDIFLPPGAPGSVPPDLDRLLGPDTAPVAEKKPRPEGESTDGESSLSTRPSTTPPTPAVQDRKKRRRRGRKVASSNDSSLVVAMGALELEPGQQENVKATSNADVAAHQKVQTNGGPRCRAGGGRL